MARDGNEALQLFEETGPDILLLDLMLPKMSGIDVCRTIRARSSVPIIMVTAKGTEIDTVVALEVGADDYVTKPYRLRELVARMRAVLRRAPGGPESTDESGTIGLGRRGHMGVQAGSKWTSTSAGVRAGEEVHLRRKEFGLLRLLVENSGRVLARDVLIDRVWGTDYIGDTKTLDVRVKRLLSGSMLTPPPRSSSRRCAGSATARGPRLLNQRLAWGGAGRPKHHVQSR